MMRVHARWMMVLLAFTAAFVVFQLYLLRVAWVNLETAENGRGKKKRRYDDWNPTQNYIAVQLFAEVASDFSVPVFLIEPSILESVWAQRMGREAPMDHCRFLCTKSNATTFGVISNKWVTQNFLSAVSSSGFMTVMMESGDPRQLSVSRLDPPRVPHHYFFVLGGHLIHLVVFCQRIGASYLWHGAIDVDAARQNLAALADFPLEELAFGGKHAGSFRKMEFSDIRIDDVAVTVPKYPLVFLRQRTESRHIECNFQQAREFLEENGYGNTPQDAEFRTRATEILRRGAQALDKIEVPFWVSSGTCLGWFRECNIIGHSMDVDFGMRIQHYNDRVIPAMEAQGLQLLYRFGKKEDSFELSFARDSIKLDIFFFYEEHGYIWNGGTDDSTGEKYLYAFNLFDLCWTELVGVRVRVPCPTLPYIEANYGSDWNQKVTEWDWKDSPPNVRPNGQWPKEEWPRVMQTFPVM